MHENTGYRLCSTQKFPKLIANTNIETDFFYLKTNNMVYWCEAWNSIISIILPAWLKMRKIGVLTVKEDRIMSRKFSQVLLTIRCRPAIRAMRLTEICSRTSREG